MTKIMFKNNPINTSGNLPQKGDTAPNFLLINKDLKEVTLDHFKGKKKILSINPSLDTSVCQETTKHFNEFAKKHPEISILVITKDLPFAQKRFCSAENLKNVITLSVMRSNDFLKDYGVYLEDGPLQGLAARAVLVLDENHRVIFSKLVEEITNEPDFDEIERHLND
ncbi:MAG: thiol peroxidase [Chlamydiae bacterium CG10_big_fil_rev_8_21_14_0_10_35_9]|nr:MAG: thiol peroxidase [Chlamydiae bacterium CG10_big_fil_rev_8_21_14_0_10_35_9]